MRLLRKVLFYLFLSIYLVVCPLTILYAFGYAFQPGAERGIVKTGLIYVATNPPGASVYLGKRRYTQRTPTVLRGLFPGTYDVRLVLKDHRVWEQVVPVEREKATVLDRVLLLPRQLAPEVVLAAAFDELIPMPGNRVFLLTQGARLAETVLYDWKAERAWRLLADEPRADEARLVTRFTVPESPWLLVRTASRHGDQWLWIDPGRGEVAVDNLTNLFLEPATLVTWNPRNGRYLYAFFQGHVNRLDTVSSSVMPKWLEGIRGLGFSGRWVYVLKDNGRLVRMDRDGNSTEPLAVLPLPSDPVFGAPSLFQLSIPLPGVIVALGERGEFFAWRPPHLLVEKGVVGFDWDPHHRRIVLWQKDRVGVIALPEAPLFDEEPIPVPQVQWIPHQGNEIAQAAWVYEGSHVLVQDGDALFLLQLETYGTPAFNRLLEVKPRSAMVYGEETGAAYYLEPSTHRLARLQVLPKRERLPLPELSEPRARSGVQGR